MLVRAQGSTDGGATWQWLKVDSDGHVQIDVLSLPAAKNLGLLESIVIERVSNLNASEGANSLDCTTVPSGKILVVRSLCMLNNTSAVTAVTFTTNDGSDVYNLIRDMTGKAAEAALEWTGEIYIPATGYVRANWYGCTAGDDLYFDIYGCYITA